jgi:photoactive yellow protein
MLQGRFSWRRTFAPNTRLSSLQRAQKRTLDSILGYCQRFDLYCGRPHPTPSEDLCTLNNIEHQILTMTDVELDAYPLGIIRVDRSGKIIYYNQAEADLARRSAAETIGLNFFHDVAPCTAVQAFQGRFDTFVRKPGSGIESFAFVFRFPWGNVRVNIAMVRRSGPEDTFYIVVNFAKLSPDEIAAPR